MQPNRPFARPCGMTLVTDSPNLVSADPAQLPVVAGAAPVRVHRPVPVHPVPLRPAMRLLFAVPFLAAGAMVGYAAVRLLRGESVPEAHAPAGVLLGVSILFGGAGTWLAAGGVRELLARVTVRRRRASLPGQAWLVDYAWERDGGRDRAPGELTPAFAMAAAFAIFAGIFGWAGFGGEGGLPFRIAAVLILLGTAAFAANAARLAWRAVRWGRSRLRFADFPVAPGRTATLILDDIAPAARAVPLRATLRCIQERWETHRTGRNRRDIQVAQWALWEARCEVPAGARTVEFTLPADAPGTSLATRPARYWELELEAEVPGVDYRGLFLVPVYPR